MLEAKEISKHTLKDENNDDCFLYSTKQKYTWSASLVAQAVKNPPAMQETQVQFLGRADPLEKRMATHSSILAWRIPWTEELCEL